MKVVLNISYGGFRLSNKAVARLKELGVQVDNNGYNEHYKSIKRTDHRLVQVVEELGDAAAPHDNVLSIVEIPDGIDWVLEEYDGVESILEVGHFWPGDVLASTWEDRYGSTPDGFADED